MPLNRVSGDVLIQEVVRTPFVGSVPSLSDIHFYTLTDPLMGSLVSSIHCHEYFVNLRRKQCDAVYFRMLLSHLKTGVSIELNVVLCMYASRVDRPVVNCRGQ